MEEKAGPLEGALNFGDAQKEAVTPHKISIFTLIKTFGEMKLKVMRRKLGEDNMAALTDDPSEEREKNISTPKYRKTFCMMILKLLQDPDLSMSDLHSLLVSKQDNLFEDFLPEFQQNLRSVQKMGIEGLMSLVKRVSLLLTEPTGINPVITKSSVLGLFIRRTSVIFEQLTCSGVVAIFKVFNRYCEACPAILEDAASKKESVIQEEEHYEPKGGQAVHKEGQDKGILWTRRQADLFLAQQSLLLQKNDPSIDTKKLHSNIQQLLRANPDCAEAYFLAFLNFLRVRDFPAALHSLHNCFDRGGGLYFDPNSKQLCGNSNDERARSFRYGALNLAMLYASFGHKDEALLALKECVMLARSAHCNFCLQHALSWFCKLSGNPGKEKLMECSIARSSEFNLGYLTSLAIQSLAQHVSSQQLSPEHIFDLISQSDILNCQHSLPDLTGNIFAQKATLWVLYGRPGMASLHSQLLLHSEAQNYNAEATCAAVCHLAMQFMADGDQVTSAVLISFARENFPQLDVQPVWIRCEQILGFSHFLNQGSWQLAKVAAEQLSATDKWEGSLRMAELEFAQGDREKSLHRLENVNKKCNEDPSVPLMIQICNMSLASKILENSPFSYCSHLVNALSVSTKHYLAPVRYKIIMQIAEHQLKMGLVSQALVLIDSVMTMVLTHGSLLEQGSYLFLKAKCQIYKSHQENSPAQSPTNFYNVLETLAKARANFEKVQAVSRVKEVLLCTLLLHHVHQQDTEKYKVAYELRIFEEQLASRKSSHV